MAGRLHEAALRLLPASGPLGRPRAAAAALPSCALCAAADAAADRGGGSLAAQPALERILRLQGRAAAAFRCGECAVTTCRLAVR